MEEDQLRQVFSLLALLVQSANTDEAGVKGRECLLVTRSNLLLICI